MHRSSPFCFQRTGFALTMGVTLLLSWGVAAETARVPELLGMPLDTARSTAETAGIALIVEMEDSAQPRGSVIDQIPGAGALLGEDRRVRLAVSDGHVVPDLTGMRPREAEAALAQLGVFSETTHRPIREVGAIRAGRVGLSIPPAGTRIDASRQVVFIVVAEIGTFTLPANIVGMRHHEATRLLEDQGLRVTLDQQIASNIDPGLCGDIVIYSYTVRGVSPRPDTAVLPGDQVHLRLNEEVQRIRLPCTPEGVPY